MRISHGAHTANQVNWNGYGYVTECMLSSLRRLGHEVDTNLPNADVEIWYDQPQHWKFQKNTYKIGYHPWESTLLLPGWSDIMNQCDEIWTPSPLIARWYQEYAGITVPVYVYEHGVDDIWTPAPRPVEDKFTFLHVGAEASRKGAREVIGAFRHAFPREDHVELNLKMISRSGWKIGKINRVNILNEKMPLTELVSLYQSNHVYVYPSWGEGFGLSPLQALATGMPTQTLPAWAPYAEHLHPALGIRSNLARSQWPKIHPGRMFRPDTNSIIEGMRDVYNNYDYYRDWHLDRVAKVKEQYSWDKLTSEAFSALESRLK